MGTSSLAALAGMGLFAMLVMLVVYILVGALILSVSFRLVVGFMPSYLRALAAVVLAWIATFVVSLVLRMILPASAGGLLSLADRRLRVGAPRRARTRAAALPAE